MERARCTAIFKNPTAVSFGFEMGRYPRLTIGVLARGIGRARASGLILVVLRWRPLLLITFPWTDRLRRRHVLRRKEDVVARLAQARAAGSQTCFHAVRVRHIGAAKSKGVRGAGFALLRGSLSECEGWENEKKAGHCGPAANSTPRHCDFLLHCRRGCRMR